MKYHLNTKDLERAFSEEDIALIRWQFLSAAEHANRFISNDKEEQLHVNFWVSKPYPLWGMGACAPSSDRMQIYLHPDTFYLRNNKNNGRERFSAVIAHERHHNERWRSQGYGETFGEMTISEGLALKFQRETGHLDFSEERYLRGEALYNMAERAKPLLDIVMPEYGKPLSPELSSVNSYALGLPLAEGWCRYSGMTAAAAHDVPAREVLVPWLEGKFQISYT